MANVLGELFGDIASAIREKTGDAEKMKPADFPEKISSIETGTGVDVSGVTATAADVLEGKTIVGADGNMIAGSIPVKGAFSTMLSADKSAVNIPEGYHNGEGRITVYSVKKTVTPTKERQTVYDSGGMNQAYLDYVTVEPIPDQYQDVSNVTATADDVRSGKVFVDAEGNEVEGALSGTIADVSEVTAKAEDVLEGKVIVTSTGNKVYGTMVQREPVLQEKTATENGIVEPDAGFDGLSKVIVDVLASGGGNAKIASGTFTGVGGSSGSGNKATKTIAHNLGKTPDLVFIACNGNITTTGFGILYFAVGLTTQMKQLTTFDAYQFGCSYGFNSWTSFNNKNKDITATTGALFTNANETQFTVSDYYITAKGLEYRWIAISGLT